MTRLAAALAGLALALTTAPVLAADPALSTDTDKTIYAIGLSISRNLAPLDLSEAEIEVLKLGIADGVLGRKHKVSPEEFLPKAQELAQQRVGKIAEAETKESAAFLAKIEKEDGVEKTASGLLYKEVTAGKGEKPKASNTVKVNYHGTLRDGSVFDSSIERGEPIEFPLDQVIPCWTEALQKMAPGGKAQIWCPASIAYKDRGAPPMIKPGAALRFDVELLSIGKAKEAGAEKPGKVEKPKD